MSARARTKGSRKQIKVKDLPPKKAATVKGGLLTACDSARAGCNVNHNETLLADRS